MPAELAALHRAWIWGNWEYALLSEDGAFKRGPFGHARRHPLDTVALDRGPIQTSPVRGPCVGRDASSEKILRTRRSRCRLRRITVAGSHFIQEDSPDEIGRAIAEWYQDLS